MLHLFADSAHFCLYSFTGFLREEGKDEKEETAPGQPADHHHIQVYLRPSCILWTSSYRQPCLSDPKGHYPFSMAARMYMCFVRERRGKTEERKGKEARCNLPRISPTWARKLQFPPLYIQSEWTWLHQGLLWLQFQRGDTLHKKESTQWVSALPIFCLHWNFFILGFLHLIAQSVPWHMGLYVWNLFSLCHLRKTKLTENTPELTRASSS